MSLIYGYSEASSSENNNDSLDSSQIEKNKLDKKAKFYCQGC